jgi:hypothetical protein
MEDREMISSVEKIIFNAIADQGTLAEIDVVDAYQVAVLVDIDSHAGTATNTIIGVLPVEDQVLGNMVGATPSGDQIRKTRDLTNTTGVFYLDRHDTAIAEPAFENAYRKIRVVADLVGAGHTITGSVYIFKKKF